MERMTRAEMITFLRGMNRKQEFLEEEKRRLRGSIETMEEAIARNTFSRKADEGTASSPGFSPDKVLRILLNSERDIEEQTKAMVYRMRDLYEEEDQIEYIRRLILQMDGKDQRLLNEVYIQDVVVDQAHEKLGMSRSNLYRLLQRAVQRLLDRYNAGCKDTYSSKAQRLIREVNPFMPEGSIA